MKQMHKYGVIPYLVPFLVFFTGCAMVPVKMQVHSQSSHVRLFDAPPPGYTYNVVKELHVMINRWDGSATEQGLAELLRREAHAVGADAVLNPKYHIIFNPFGNIGWAKGVAVSLRPYQATPSPSIIAPDKKKKVVRGWLGVMIQKITPELKDKLKLKDERGALVADVTAGGPADKAGIKRGDVIVSFDGKVIKEMEDLPYIVGFTPVNKTVLVEVIRKARKRNFQIKIGEIFLARSFAPDKKKKKKTPSMSPSGSELHSPSKVRTLKRATTGVYALEQSITFNVLDQVVYDSESGQITLVGHTDYRFSGPSIPYLQHLATLLENPAPAFSLEWTPDSERRVDDFMRRMDNVSDWQQVTAESMRLVDASDRLTPQAKAILPMLGVYPTRTGGVPGYLGVTVRISSDNDLEVTSVASGSPAARAGVCVGDIIRTTSLGQFFHPFQLTREIRAAGAGTEVTLTIFRKGIVKSPKIKVILGAAAGDSWAGVGRKDIILTVLRTDGYGEVANTVQRVMDLSTLAHKGVSVRLHTIGIYWHGKRLEKYNETFRLRDQGRITQREGEIRVMRLIPEILDDVMQIPGRPITGVYDAKIRQGMDYGRAYDMAITEMERHLKQRFIKIWKKLIARPQEITMPLDYARSAMGFSPQVEPKFIRLDPGSALARAMFEADYVAKTMVHNPEMANRIPGYQTLYSFERGRAGSGGATATERMWLSIAALDLAQSPDGNNLRTRGATMRFNIEGIGGRTVSAPYADYLTSLYDGIARAIPVFHELREAAKLTGTALWLRQKAPDLHLPPSQAVWQPPRVLPGTIYQTWSPRPGSNRIVMMAMGGVSMVPPVGPSGPVWPLTQPLRVPHDPSVVDLSDSESTRVPRLLSVENNVISKKLRRDTVPPVPRPAGWVARHAKGERVLRALNFQPQEMGKCKAVEAAALFPDLEHAHRVAEQLDAVEEAINIITDQYPARQAAFKEWGQRLEQAREDFIENALDVATQGLSATHETMRQTRLARRWGSANELASDMLKAKGELDSLDRGVNGLSAFVAGLRADDIAGRNEAIRKLTVFAKDLSENAVVLGSDRASQALRSVTKSFRYARMLKGAVGIGGSLVTLGNAWQQIVAMTELTEKETQALNDTLLPLKRQLSDQLDQAMSAPTIKKWLAGQSHCQ